MSVPASRLSAMICVVDAGQQNDFVVVFVSNTASCEMNSKKNKRYDFGHKTVIAGGVLLVITKLSEA